MALGGQRGRANGSGGSAPKAALSGSAVTQQECALLPCVEVVAVTAAAEAQISTDSGRAIGVLPSRPSSLTASFHSSGLVVDDSRAPQELVRAKEPWCREA